MFTDAIRAQAFQHEVDAVHMIAFRDADFRHGDLFQAVCPVAGGAIKMSVKVVVRFLAVAMAEFVPGTVAPVLHNVHQVMVTEQG